MNRQSFFENELCFKPLTSSHTLNFSMTCFGGRTLKKAVARNPQNMVAFWELHLRENVFIKFVCSLSPLNRSCSPSFVFYLPYPFLIAFYLPWRDSMDTFKLYLISVADSFHHFPDHFIPELSLWDLYFPFFYYFLLFLKSES